MFSVDDDSSPDTLSQHGLAFYGSSEHVLQRELKFPCILSTGNHSKVRSCKDSTRQVEIRMIEDVEDIPPELQHLVFAQAPTLLQRQIQSRKAGAEQDIPSGIS